MTALAGFLALDGRDPAPPVARILRSQAMYGHHSAQRTLGPAALGRQLFPRPPEDIHDHGPCPGGEGSLLLAADVRLDNRDELARDLSIGADRLRVLSDTALLMRSLERWGEAALGRLLGDFAFALWDSRLETLLLARDFAGQRPLHYHAGNGFFAFASMPKGLHALPEIPREPDPEPLAAFLGFRIQPLDTSFYRGIRKVPPGHVVAVSRSGIEVRRHWTPPDTPLILRDGREYEEAVRAELDRAVAAQLRGAGARVGAHLSAGLDSPAVTATAARLLAGSGSLVAYTAVPRPGFDDDGSSRRIADEGILAAQVAAAYPNVQHVRVRNSSLSPLDPLDRYFHAFEEPLPNLCNGAWSTAIFDHARAEGLTVFLTGQGGNLTFSYDGMAALSQMLRDRRLLSLARLTFQLLRRGTRAGTVAAQLLGPLLPPGAWRMLSRLRGRPRELTETRLVRPSLLPKLEEAAAERGLDLSYRPTADPHRLRLRGLGRADPGNYNKGILGGWGLDLRDPTADRRLGELCLRIPAEQFLAGGVPRSLARRALADRLPAALLEERRKGHQAADWHEALTCARSGLAEEIRRAGGVPLAGELLDLDRMAALVEDWPEDGWSSPRVAALYRHALLSSVSAAHFMRKASGANA